MKSRLGIPRWVAVLSAATLAIAVTKSACAQSSLSVEQWQSDLNYLATRLPVVHPNLFHRITRQDFEAAVDRLRRRIPELEPHQILIEFARLTALIGEVHTGIMVQRQPRELLATLHGFPIRLYVYGDGLFVQAIDAANAQAAGLRVLRIGSVDVAEALRRVGEIIPADNPMWAKRYGPGYLGVAEVLHALGISSSRTDVTFTLQDKAGKKMAISLTARPLSEVVEFLNPLSEPQPRPGDGPGANRPTVMAERPAQSLLARVRKRDPIALPPDQYDVGQKRRDNGAVLRASPYQWLRSRKLSGLSSTVDKTTAETISRCHLSMVLFAVPA